MIADMAVRSVLCCKGAIARVLTLSATPPSSCRFPLAFATSSPASSSSSSFCQALQTCRCSTRPSPSPLSPSSILLEDAASAPDAGAAAPAAYADIDSLDIRVGRIVRAWKHPEADSLYVEEVDLGEPEGPRTICSGLVKYVSEDELQGRSVMVLVNLKPRNMRGIKSNGMLLAASDASHENVELLTPSDGSLPGERAWFGAEVDKESQGTAATPNQLQKKKTWEAVQPHLKTTEECVATFKDKPMRTSMGVVMCKSLKGANIA